MKKDFVFTSESVTEGHPDKLCDQVSDAIVDHFLEQDRYSRVIAECAVSSSILFIAARFASDAVVDSANIARRVIRRVGYEGPDFNAKTCGILTSLKELPVDDLCCFDDRNLTDEEIERIPARNQVTAFGFACDQTPSLMPLPIWLAHKICRRISEARRSGVLPFLRPESKVDVGVEYRGRRPHRIHSITITASQGTAHRPDLETLREAMRAEVIRPVFFDESVAPDDSTEIFINPDGVYLNGGPSVHSGLTGRKNAIDTYGEYSRHSGAALSGKDPLRIDRVAAYAARYAAKNIVAAGLASECEVHLSYSIARSRPVSVQVETFGTAKVADSKLTRLAAQCFDFRLGGILRQFELRDLPARNKGNFFSRLAAYGHLGRTDLDLPWERTDRSEALRDAVKSPVATGKSG